MREEQRLTAFFGGLRRSSFTPALVVLIATSFVRCTDSPTSTPATATATERVATTAVPPFTLVTVTPTLPSGVGTLPVVVPGTVTRTPTPAEPRATPTVNPASTASQFVAYPKRDDESLTCTLARSFLEGMFRTPRITSASPMAVRAGTAIVVQGDGFVPGDSLTVSLAIPNEAPRGGGNPFAVFLPGDVLATAPIDGTGSFEAAFVVPAQIGGTSIAGSASSGCLGLAVYGGTGSTSAHALLERLGPP
jgi:hypothetical protein